MDNASSHRKQIVKDTIKETKNDYVYVLSYHHFQNPIEKMFNQLKHYMRKDEPMSFDLIKDSVKRAIKKITKDNMKNYFKSSLRKTKKEVEDVKTKYRKKPKVYKT